MYLQPVRIGVAEYPADQGLSSPSPCQLHLHQRQLTQQSLFCWLPETLAFKGKKKKAPFPGHPLLTPDSGSCCYQPLPPHPAPPRPQRAQRAQRGWGPGACGRAHRHAPGRRHPPGHLAPPRQSQRALFLRLARARAAWNPKVRVPSWAKAASREQSCQCESSLGRWALGPSKRSPRAPPQPPHTPL